MSEEDNETEHEVEKAVESKIVHNTGLYLRGRAIDSWYQLKKIEGEIGESKSILQRAWECRGARDEDRDR